MIRLIYISNSQINDALYDAIKGNEFLEYIKQVDKQNQIYEWLETRNIDSRYCYAGFMEFETLNEAVEYTKTNSHIFHRDNCVYYFHSELIHALNNPVVKHHLDRIRTLRLRV